MDTTPTPEETSAQAEHPKPQGEIDIAQLKAQYEVEKLQKEIKKLERETEKVELDLRDLRPQWFKRPLVLAAFLPSVLAILTLAYASSTGWFQVETKRLENRQWDLKQEQKKLERDSTSLVSKNIRLQKRFENDSLKVVAEQLSMKIELDSERSKNFNSILSARAKAAASVTLVRKQAQLDKQALEESAKKMSFEALLAFAERRQYFWFENNGNPLKVERAEAVSSRMLISVLKGHDKRAEELRSILVNKVLHTKNLRPEAIGLYLYALYKGTEETAWRDQFMTKSQTVLTKPRSQTYGEFEESSYLDLFTVLDWSAQDKDELGQCLIKNIRSLSSTPARQSILLNYFVEMVGLDGTRPNYEKINPFKPGGPVKMTPAFYQRHPSDFIYLLQLSRSILLSSGNFHINGTDRIDEDKLDGPIRWLSIFAPAAMVAVTAHILAKDTIQGVEQSLVRECFHGVGTALFVLHVEESDYPPNYNDGAEQWQSWSARYPRLQFWLTPNLSFLANDPEQLEERLHWNDTKISNESQLGLRKK